MHLQDTVLATIQKGKQLMLFLRIICYTRNYLYRDNAYRARLALVPHLQTLELNLFLQKRTKEEDYVWYCFLLNTINNTINLFLIVVRTKSKEWGMSLYPSFFHPGSLNWEHCHNSHSWILRKNNVLCMIYKFTFYFSALFLNGQSQYYFLFACILKSTKQKQQKKAFSHENNLQ